MTNVMRSSLNLIHSEAMTGFADFARFAGLYQTPLNIGQRGDCAGQQPSYDEVTVNGRASFAPHPQARGQTFPLMYESLRNL